jgi:hypothetical protein
MLSSDCEFAGLLNIFQNLYCYSIGGVENIDQDASFLGCSDFISYSPGTDVFNLYRTSQQGIAMKNEQTHWLFRSSSSILPIYRRIDVIGFAVLVPNAQKMHQDG